MPAPVDLDVLDFEEYRVLEPLGKGAMGSVYLAQDLLLDRLVAIKFVRGASADVIREQFLVEARAIARLQHPNVVAVYRVGEVRGRQFLVSEYVRGKSLDQLERPMPWTRVLEIGRGLAAGLAAAHRRGVLHRDIKPGNAILSEEDGAAKLLDFGLAKLLHATPETAEPTSPAGGWTLPDEGSATMSITPEPNAPNRQTDAVLPSGSPDAPEEASPPDPAERPVGSPLYMAPELWRGAPATRRSDVYSLGVLLYELCAGAAPNRGVPVEELPRRVQEVGAPPLAQVVPGVPAELAAIVDRCLSRDPLARFESGDAVHEALERRAAAGRAIVPDGNPYRGLAAFAAEHRALFFGRDQEARAILDRLRSQPFVLVTGDSGVGKSSLCRAGVLAAIADGALGEPWTVVELLPGRRPLLALAAALAPILDGGEAAIAERLAFEPERLGFELRERGRALVFVDQLEELLTLSKPDEAHVVAAALGALVVRTPSIRLLGTARSDFLTRLTTLPSLGAEISDALHLLPSLSAAGLRDAIVGPARAKNFSFEDEAMVAALLASAEREPGGLPLLQFALAELWGARDEARRIIPRAVLDELGGVEGALARHADRILDALPAAEREAARRLLMQLVTVEGTHDQRTAAELSGRDGLERNALEALVRGRILVARQSAGESVYELAHEALLSAWGTLRDWLLRSDERRAAQERLRRAAAEWERLGRAPDALWNAVQLRDARLGEPDEWGPRERAFFTASRRALGRRRLAWFAAAAAVPAAVAVVFVAGGARARQSLDQAIADRVSAGEAALAGAEAARPRVDRLRAEAFAAYDGKNWPAGEERWAEARRLAETLDADYRRASGAFEAALVLDPARARARQRFGEVTLQRLLLAERFYQRALVEELSGRLQTHDDRASLAQLRAPARVRVESSPPGATVALERASDPRAPAAAFPGVASPLVGVTPLTFTMDPGSTIWIFEAPGRVAVRLPVLLARADDRALSPSLPARVPDGFVYVPEGEVEFGSADDEAVRAGFLKTVPLHAIHTAAYFIGRTEVTFADWIAFLNALPPDERRRRTPGARSPDRALELRALAPNRWQLRFGNSTTSYVADQGAEVRFTRRARRARQDWLRFPVSAVSFEDGLAYAAWLDRTGRLPGARLCNELEWERAARGADGRTFPSGERLDADDADLDVTYGRDALAMGPDEVGAHARSASPFGVQDLAGNVWEWTTSFAVEGEPILRGGSWYEGDLTARSNNREPGERGTRDLLIGLRLCTSR